MLELLLSEQCPMLQVCVHLDGSNTENKISLLVILCIIMYVTKKNKLKKRFLFFLFTKPITDYGKISVRINRPIREIYFHFNNNLRKRKKNCATSSLCRVLVHFCAARKETRRQKAASYFFRLILQKRKDLFLFWTYTNKRKRFTIPIIMTKRSSCFHS